MLAPAWHRASAQYEGTVITLGGGLQHTVEGALSLECQSILEPFAPFLPFSPSPVLMGRAGARWTQSSTAVCRAGTPCDAEAVPLPCTLCSMNATVLSPPHSGLRCLFSWSGCFHWGRNQETGRGETRRLVGDDQFPQNLGAAQASGEMPSLPWGGESCVSFWLLQGHPKTLWRAFQIPWQTRPSSLSSACSRSFPPVHLSDLGVQALGSF